MTSLDRDKLAAAHAVFSKEGGMVAKTLSGAKSLLTKILPIGAKRGAKGAKTALTKVVPKATEKAVKTTAKKVGGKGAKTIATKIMPAAGEATEQAVKGTAKTVARKGGGRALRTVGKGLAAGGALAGLGAGAYALGKGKKMPALDPSLFMPPPHIRPDLYAPPPEKEEEGDFTDTERRQFARHGLDPERLKFMRTLGAYRQGMNLDRKLFEQALAGKLPANILGGGGEDEEDLESYA
jgi:hypothetical protein